MSKPALNTVIPNLKLDKPALDTPKGSAPNEIGRGSCSTQRWKVGPSPGGRAAQATAAWPLIVGLSLRRRRTSSSPGGSSSLRSTAVVISIKYIQGVQPVLPTADGLSLCRRKAGSSPGGRSGLRSAAIMIKPAL